MKSANFVNVNFMGQNILIRKSAGSHIPVLKSIAKKMNIKNVIEVGTGLFSLKTFLDRSCFPDLEKLYSYESSNLWIEYMNSIFKDKRWRIKLIEDNYDLSKDMMSNSKVDLVFVDALYEHRLYVLNNFKDLYDIFVLHDCELDQFSDIIKNGFKYKFVYVPPKYRHTAILSQKIDVGNIDWDIKWDDSFTKWI